MARELRAPHVRTAHEDGKRLFFQKFNASDLCLRCVLAASCTDAAVVKTRAGGLLCGGGGGMSHTQALLS